MIGTAHSQGVDEALAHFQIKEADAGSMLGRFGRGLRDFAVGTVFGDAPQAFVQGGRAFSSGGALHPKSVLWPSHWRGRIGNLAMVPLTLPGMMHQDPQEGTLSRTLGGLGGVAGMLYGGTAGGMIGMPIGTALGHGLGKGVGHLLGSHPKDPYQ